MKTLLVIFLIALLISSAGLGLIKVGVSIIGGILGLAVGLIGAVIGIIGSIFGAIVGSLGVLFFVLLPILIVGAIIVGFFKLIF